MSDVAVGSTVVATFAITSAALALTDLETGDIVSTPGNYTLLFADGSGHELRTSLTVTGPQHVFEAFPQL
jgi:hypothetical protein